MPKTQRIRSDENSKVYDEISLAGCTLYGELAPEDEELTNNNVKEATPYTSYIRIPTGEIYQKKINNSWQFETTITPGTQNYDIEPTKPLQTDIRPEGSIWYYKPVTSPVIEEIYVCMENNGGLSCTWGLIDNLERLLEKDLISKDAGGFYAGFTFTQDIEKSTVPGSATTSYLKKNDYPFPPLPAYNDFNLTSGKDFSNRYTIGSEINGGDAFGMMKCIDNTTGACLWTSDMGAGNAYVNMDASQVSYLSEPNSIKTVRFKISPSAGTLIPDPSGWYTDNWGATTDPDNVNNNVNQGFFFGSYWTNLTSGDIFFCGPNVTGGDIEWRKIYDASTSGQTSYLGFIIEPTISENVGGVSNFTESNFGVPTINTSAPNTPDFIINNIGGNVRIQYTGIDKVFVIDFKISADTLAQDGIFEYGLFKTSVTALNLLDLSITVLSIGNAGVNAYSHCSSTCTVNLTNGDEIHIGRRGINAAAQFITPVLINFSIKELK
jgi:hypothetical protein